MLMELKFRHEFKHEITSSDMVIITQRLNAVAKPDPHAINGLYYIRSIYFDNLYDTALREKIDGVNFREKFRMRYYNGDTGRIMLEKKSKINGLCNKQSARITAEEAQKIIDGDLDWMPGSGRPLVQELYSKMRSGGLKPKTIVDYTRRPFVYGPGNVRVTIDYNVRTGMQCTDFLNRDCVTVPAGESPVILEVKWDEYLPDIIRDAVQLEGRRAGAYSKYAACRIYG